MESESNAIAYSQTIPRAKENCKYICDGGDGGRVGRFVALI